MSAPLPLSTASEVRRAFWDEHPELRRRHQEASNARTLAAVKKDLTVAFGLFLAELVTKREIAPELVGRVTLL